MNLFKISCLRNVYVTGCDHVLCREDHMLLGGPRLVCGASMSLCSASPAPGHSENSYLCFLLKASTFLSSQLWIFFLSLLLKLDLLKSKALCQNAYSKPRHWSQRRFCGCFQCVLSPASVRFPWSRNRNKVREKHNTVA